MQKPCNSPVKEKEYKVLIIIKICADSIAFNINHACSFPKVISEPKTKYKIILTTCFVS